MARTPKSAPSIPRSANRPTTSSPPKKTKISVMRTIRGDMHNMSEHGDGLMGLASMRD